MQRARPSRLIPTLTADAFRRLLEAEPDALAASPYVVEGLVDQWPAARSWSNLQRLRDLFGHHPVTAGAPQFTTHRDAEICEVSTTYGTYLDYVEAPARAETLFRDGWIHGSYERWRRMDRPLYCGNVRIARSAQDPAIADIQPLAPPGFECWNDDIPFYYKLRNHIWLYVGLAGALTPLHADNNGVIAYLAQIAGRKRATLFSPADRIHYYDADLGYFDPLSPRTDQFPTWAQAEPWTAELCPGQLLIWGADWAHHVVTETNSITVSFDLVNLSNIALYARSRDWMEHLGRRVRETSERGPAQLPVGVADPVDETPLWRKGFAIMQGHLEASLRTSIPDRSRAVHQRLLGEMSAALADLDPGRETQGQAPVPSC